MAYKSKPWLTKGILKSINTRIKYYKKFMSTKDVKWYKTYKVYCDKINHLIRKNENNYYKKYFIEFKQTVKNMEWYK